MGDIDQAELKVMREKVNWNVESERLEFLNYFYTLIENWEEVFLNLRDIFREEEIECLLRDTVLQYCTVNRIWPEDENNRQVCFIRFVARTSGYKYEPEVDKNGKPLLHRITPVHIAARRNCDFLMDDLFKIYNRFDLNYTTKDGLTHFHVACIYGLDDVVEKFLELGQDPNCLWQGYTPLHLTVRRKCKKVAQLLLENNADPNVADAHGRTLLHFLCRKPYKNDYEMAEMLFEFSDKYQPVLIDAQDNSGNTPLHLAPNQPRLFAEVTELLLRRGSDPNVANNDGLTPLHIICKSSDSDMLVKIFLKINLELDRQVQVDARDKSGNTPLHYALQGRNEQTVLELLTYAANPNLADAQGCTPLHIIFMRAQYDLIQPFFKVNDKKHQTVNVNVVDNLGRTPLHLAVASLNLFAVDMLLDRGADCSSFVFPTESQFDEKFNKFIVRSRFIKYNDHMKLASFILIIVEHLEKRGYQMNRSDAATIMALFAKYGLFEKSSDLEKLFYDEEFVGKSKKILVKDNDSGLSLYDLIRLRNKEMTKLFTSTDFYKLANTNKLLRLNPVSGSQQLCINHLCQKMWRGFFLSWALDPFLELTRYQLPILCCRKIIELLMNKDIHRICLAVADQSSQST